MENNGINARFSEATWIHNYLVTIGGVGGIGSNVVYLLAKHGISMYLYDADTVELHNVGGQNFDRQDVGLNKCIAMKNKIRKINRGLSLSINEMFINTSTITSIAFACFDNMVARKVFYDAWKKLLLSNSDTETNPFILIDGRQNAETLDIYIVTKETMQRYEEEALFDDSEVEDLPCNFKSTTHTGFLTSGLMVSAYTNFMSNFNTKEDVRTLPFRMQFTIPMMYYETIN